MAVGTHATGVPSLVRLEAELTLEALLGGYAQILFSRSPWVGALLLLATAVDPRMMGFGVAAVMLATLSARALRLSPDLIRSGLFGYNALLVGLGGASLVQHTPMGLGLLVTAVMGSVLVTAAIHSALGFSFGLPALTLPFLAVFYVVLGAAPLADIPLRSLTADPVAIALGIPAAARLFLQSLGALFFLPRVDAGALVLVALLFHSRIASVLALLAFTVVAIFQADLFVLADPTLAIMLGYNCILIAIALGGVWFVPSAASFALATAGVLMGGLFTLGILPRLAFAGLPLLILPFNLTVILVLYAMRQRTRDGSPKSVDFLIGTPEENLNYFRTRLARFGAHYSVRFGAPFRGRWTCSQSVEGSLTHRGPWRHALDFQVADDSGQVYRGTGGALRDYLCYRLPVLATADGVVAKVVDGVPDNEVGAVNLEDNWGNVVVLYHGPGLHSLVAHLAPGTVKVREGQPVQRGEVLGLCGNSGRSPYPHLHFQLQATARVGAPTLAVELHDVISGAPGQERLHGTLVPDEGESVRNIEPEADVARRLRIEPGEVLRLRLDDGREVEALESVIDLLGNLTLVSRDKRATLFYEHRSDLFTVYDVVGGDRSGLHLLRAALSRVPFETRDGLEWTDALPRRRFLPAALRPLFDLASPFVGETGIEMRYESERRADGLLIRGRSVKRWRKNRALVETEAFLSDARGLERVTATVRGRRRRAERCVESEPGDSENRRWARKGSLGEAA